MLMKPFSHLLSAARFSRSRQLVWLLFLLLSPVAYLASAALVLKIDPSTHLDFQIDRAEAIRAASGYAATLGIETQHWTSGVRAVVNNDRYYYYRQHQNEEAARVRRLAPEADVQVIFLSPDREQSLNIKLTRDGQPLGYDLTLPASAEVKDPGEETARKLAVEAYSSLQQQAGLSSSGDPVLSEERKFNRVIRRYRWHLPLASLPGLDLQAAVAVLGDKVVEQDIVTEFDPAYARTHFVNRQLLPKLVLVPYGILIFVVACYGLYRYIRRSWQKEVPHARSLLLGGIISFVFFFIALQSQFHLFSLNEVKDVGQLYWVILLSTFMLFIVMGMALGLAYGSGEGDVREAYPGKLTSLDALITGRFFSRNVARAVLVGSATGGWSLLAHFLVLLPWVNRPASGLGFSEHFFSLLYGYYSWLLPLLNPPLGAVQIAVIGLLLPLSFLSRRRFRSERLRLGLLVVLSFISALGVFQEQPMPLLAGLLMAGVRTATLLVLFFTLDLLAALVAIATPALAVFILYFTSQPTASMQRAGLIAAGVALALLLIEIIFLFRGREYTEDEVRPLYARHIAERLRLKAEVSAAREAQVRLLPQKLPEVSGLSLAAACYPARVVGGDFYDLFTLGEQRLGIFVAEGGGYGLGAALAIAFAKGFLMPRIVADHTPAEILYGLQEQLAPMLEEGQEMALVYAVFDPSALTLTYARGGSYPQIRISRAGSLEGDGRGRRKQGALRYDLQPEEREVLIPAMPGAAQNRSLREAKVQLAPGDTVIIVTDGIVENLRADHQVTLEDWMLEAIFERQGNAPEQLQQVLNKALERRARRTKKIGVEDDLTAILVRLNSNGAARR